MKKQQIIINEYENLKGSYTITISNARYHKKFPENITKLFKRFINNNDDLFLGLYRIDGINLASDKQEELKKDIPAFLQKHGEVKNQNEYLTVAKIKIDDCIYGFIPSIFDYYLETILFNPKISWEFFQQFYFDYLKYRYDDYILNDFTDILIFYSDSGDFSVCFNPKKYTPKEVRSIIDKIVNEC